MTTIQVKVDATNVAKTFITGSQSRIFFYIKNYASPLSSDNMYIAFGQAATNGLNGELELLPGQELVFGGTSAPQNCPQGSISIISPTTANGCLLINQ